MAYKTFAAILNLISVYSPEYQEIAMISQLNCFFNFDHNVLLLHSSADINRFVNTKQQTPQTLYVFESDYLNDVRLESIADTKKKNNFLIVVPANFEQSLHFVYQLGGTQKLKTNLKIGVFFSQLISSDELKRFFQLCWENRIINIFVSSNAYCVTQESCSESVLETFTYNPFGTFDVINVTASTALDTYFLSQKSNFHQHIIRVAEPAFIFITSKSDKTLWLAVFRVMNASSTEIQCDNNVNSRSKFFEKNSVDVVTDSYGTDPPIIVNMYPMRMEDVVIVVPEASNYGEFSVYLQTVTSDNFFSYSIIIIFAVMLQLCFFRYYKQKKILLLQSIADVANLLMNDNGAIKYQHLSCVEACLIIPLTVSSF